MWTDCDPTHCTRSRWNDDFQTQIDIDEHTIQKDTVIVPAGGFVVINFLSDNPGHWFLHFHIEVHQLEGMAVIVNEALDKQLEQQPPDTLNQCGSFYDPLPRFYKLLQPLGFEMPHWYVLLTEANNV